MATLRFVTLTGVDQKTSFTKLVALARLYPFVEWGVLVSPANASATSGRYPTLDWVEAFGRKAAKAGLNIAVHLCGDAVHALKNEVKGAHPHENSKALAQQVLRIISHFDRVQINTRAKLDDVGLYEQVVRTVQDGNYDRQVILQWNEANEPVCQRMSWLEGFETLFDASGGRGVAPAEWPDARLKGARHTGYAGGLGPDNLAEQLPLIAKAAGDRMFWVDMETKLRDKRDRFDLAVCEQVLKTADDYIEADRKAKGAVWGNGYIDVAKLTEWRLDWWVGKVSGRDMLIPPKDAYRAMEPWWARGRYEAYVPSESGNEALRLAQKHRIQLKPLDDKRWEAQAVASDEHPNPPAMPGSTPQQAILRAIVAKHRGTRVPKNFARA